MIVRVQHAYGSVGLNDFLLYGRMKDTRRHPRAMADYERTILTHYNLENPYPTQWPAERDDSDPSDEDLPPALKARLNVLLRPSKSSKSRFSALERNSSGRRSLVPGSQKTQDGLENLVQQDEPDPLGGYDSVVRVLRDRGLPVESDQLLRAGTYPPFSISYTDH